MSEIEQDVVPLGGVDAPITEARLQEVRELLASIPRADPDSLTGNVQGMLYLIDQQAEALTAAEAARLELTQEIERLRGVAIEAIAEIADWAAYASDYFKEKHDLAGTLDDLRARSTPPVQS